MNNDHKENAFNSYLSRKVREKALRHREKNQSPVLDAGCGNGLLLAELCEQSPARLFGLDVSRGLLQSAREKTGSGHASFVEADALAMPFKSAQFGAVLCLNTTMNFKSAHQVQALIAEMSRICRLEGRIILDIRNGSNVLLKLKYAIFSRLARFPIQGFTQSQLRSILKRLNCEIIERIPVRIPWLPLAWDYVFVIRAKQQP
ncbi:MAG: class I SAM-dependent methyltransferase [Candidatus Zhuqueibacterota bacterium]